MRAAAGGGLTQAEIAREIGRSQPEVSRLLRFHGSSPLARRLRRHRSEVLETIAAVGGSHVRVFGSVASGTDRDGSDIGVLEARLTALLEVKVDVVPDGSLRSALRERVLAEAVPL